MSPRYQACKHQRLCDLLDTGLLVCLPHLTTLEEYLSAHERLLRGASELESTQHEPLAADPDAFIASVKRAHYMLFQYAASDMAGRVRQVGDPMISFGGDGANRRDGYTPEKIADGLASAFVLARKEGWAVERRAAGFLAHFFRVHPFEDGNGRIGRFIVQKICRDGKQLVHAWNNTGRSRRKYLEALEYAHRHCGSRPENALKFLERWIAGQLQPADDDTEDYEM